MSASLQWVDESMQIPDLLHAAPHARPVLDRYGLRGCGGKWGPPESLGFFAKAHDVPLDHLLRELRECLAQPAGASVEPPEEKAHFADTIYRPFFKAGIAVVLTLGAAWGAYLLLRIALLGRFSAAGLHEINAHGHAQIFGWVGLFVMGFAYQAFPRFKHTVLAMPGLARASWWMMVAGVVGRSGGEPLAEALPWMGSLAIASAWIEAAAIGMFVAVILATWRSAEKEMDFYDYYILSALGWFAVQAVAEAVYLAATLAVASRAELLSLVSTWQGAIREAQIHGFALLMILGVSQRLLHHFYGLPAPNRRLSLAALGCLNLAVIGEITGLAMMRGAGRGWAGLWYGSAVLLTASVVALLWNWRIFTRPGEPDRSLKFIRAGYVWLLISLGMLVLLPVYQFLLLPRLAPASAATTAGFSHAYYGAVRHAITVGFISLMIVGVASRVVPTLNGVEGRRLTPLWDVFLLINTGCALRVITQTLTDLTPHAFVVTGISGLLEVTGLALWGVHLWSVMIGCARERGTAEEIEPYVPGASLTASCRVGEVLDSYPALLATFVGLGFRPLANPLLRRTVARRVTIGQACRHMGLDELEVLAALNRAAGLMPKQTVSLPVLSVS